MRVYLDNCCYNRPFDAFGDVDAERFITLNIREPQDYTEWRKRNMYVGESVHQTAERARASGARLRAQYGISISNREPEVKG